MGFEYFYGFNAGETHQYYPVLFENTLAVDPPKSPEEGYHFMTDMTDRAISRLRFSKSVAPEKPYFMYFAPGAMHAPHHVSKEWRDRFKGQFDMGWDRYRDTVYRRQLEMNVIPAGTKLTPRPDWVPAWDGLSADQKKLYSRFMENYAGYFAFVDHEIGRLLDVAHDLPGADNTLIFFIVGDNGASAERRAVDGTGQRDQGAQWRENNDRRDAEALRRNRRAEYRTALSGRVGLGGQYAVSVGQAGCFPPGPSHNPMVVSWPAKIKPDTKARDQFLHLVDIVPTILEASGVPMPKTVDGVVQKPRRCALFPAAALSDPKAPSPLNEQYFEILSTAPSTTTAGKPMRSIRCRGVRDLAPGNWDKDRWELYNLAEDFSEAN